MCQAYDHNVSAGMSLAACGNSASQTGQPSTEEKPAAGTVDREEPAENMVNTKDKSVTSTGTQNDADSNGKVLSVTGWSGLFCLFVGKGPGSEIETNVLGCTGMTSRNVRRGKKKYQDQAKYYKYSS